MGVPVADLSASFDRFLRAVEEFWENLSQVSWGYIAAGLLLWLLFNLIRGHAWANALRAAYPEEKVSEKGVVGAFIVGGGLNGLLPARGGDALKIVLAKRAIPNSTYPAVISSFFVLSPFDSTIGFVVLGYALTQGLFPAAPRLPDLPAFDISFWASNPEVLGIVVGGLLLVLLVGGFLLRHRAIATWRRLKQGIVILTRPREYLRKVALWQLVAWFVRAGAFWFFLDAFQIGGSVDNVLLVMAVQSVASALPFTPGGAGAQQALLVASLSGPPRSAVLAYSVGQQIAVTIWTATISVLTLGLILRQGGIRNLIREGRAAREEHEAEGQAAN